MKRTVKRLEEEVAGWAHVTVKPHRFGGREFNLGSAEIGHVHAGGTVDIPFTRALHDALLAEGFAEEHRWVPNSGWVTFQMSGEGDLPYAVWLLQLSYLRYILKTAENAHDLLERESERLQLSARFKSLLEPFARHTGPRTSADALSA